MKFAILFKNFAILFKNFAILFKKFAILFKNFAILLKNFAILLKNFAILFKNVAILIKNFAILLKNFGFLALKIFKLFGCLMFSLLAYLMNVIIKSGSLTLLRYRRLSYLIYMYDNELLCNTGKTKYMQDM